VVDQHSDVRSCARVLDPPQRARALRLLVDRAVEGVAGEREYDRDEVRPTVRVDRRQPRDAGVRNPVAKPALTRGIR
jgi:hypothetical protein